jgi:hypothetical protein
MARGLNTMRMAHSVDVDDALEEMRSLAIEARDEGQYIAAAVAWKAYDNAMANKARLWHLDKISPLMGLEKGETRAQLVDALRDSAHLLTEEQRQELQDALNESADDETETTTLPPARSARR